VTPVSSSIVAPLRARRCVRHQTREAAARCVECTESFCRECVAEHDGRFLCARCLAKIAAVVRPRRNFTPVRRALAMAAGGLAMWGAFYAAGSLLGKIPVDFHEGTIWKKAAERRNQ
jgi:hypothetical protein